MTTVQPATARIATKTFQKRGSDRTNFATSDRIPGCATPATTSTDVQKTVAHSRVERPCHLRGPTTNVTIPTMAITPKAATSLQPLDLDGVSELSGSCSSRTVMAVPSRGFNPVPTEGQERLPVPAGGRSALRT